MRAGVSLTAPQFGSDLGAVLELAEVVEDSALDGVFAFDHLLPPGRHDRPIIELTALLGALAARTERCRIGSLVMRATLRGPAISTAIARTLTAIAPGRVVVGLGAGDRLSRPEVDRMGLEFGDLDARLDTLRRTAEGVTEAGATVWIGGTHSRIRTLARLHRGWNGWDVAIEEFRTYVAEMQAAKTTVTWGGPVLLASDDEDLCRLVAERSRPPRIAGTPELVADRLSELVVAGAQELVVTVIPNRADRWRLFAAEVVPRLRSVTATGGRSE